MRIGGVDFVALSDLTERLQQQLDYKTRLDLRLLFYAMGAAEADSAAAHVGDAPLAMYQLLEAIDDAVAQ